MKIFKTFIVITIMSLSAFGQQNADCVEFTQRSIDTLIKYDFLPDGRYNSVKLSQGDKMTIYKSFYKNKEYMLIFNSEETLPGITIEIQNLSSKVLTIRQPEPANYHSLIYRSKKNENLIISISVHKLEEQSEPTEQGCVTAVFGFKP